MDLVPPATLVTVWLGIVAAWLLVALGGVSTRLWQGRRQQRGSSVKEHRHG